jgi:hypothetical protein
MTAYPEPANQPAATEGFRSWIIALGVCLGISLIVVSPFFWRGNASGHDISFHASSWLDVAEQWKEGIVFPRWCEWANYGFGEPRFIFYPPLSWMLGAALSLVLPGNAVPGVFIVLVQAFAGLAMFALARRFFSPREAIFAGACYAANPYALLIVYMRSDFAEQLAWAFLPALLLAALQLFGLIENQWRTFPRAMGIFALLFAGVWLSNAPAGVMASYSLALLLSWAALREESLRPLLWGAGGLALGLGLACFYLVPAAYEQRWVNIAQALSSGLKPEQNFLYTQINDPEHNLFNWIASSVAILLMVLTGFAALFAHRNVKDREAPGERKALWPALFLLSAAATILMLRPSAILWEHLPKLRFVQFPWRWMGILAVPYAYFGAAVVARRRAGWVWVTVVLLATSSTGILLVQKAWWDSDDIPSLQDAIADGKGFEGTDEYDPAGDDHYNLLQNALPLQVLPAEGAEEQAPKAEIQIERWTAEERMLRVDSPRPLRLAVRLLNYPAWHVEVNGIAVTPELVGSTAQMILPLPEGKQGVTVKFVSTPDRIAGNGISLLSGLAVLGFLGVSQGGVASAAKKGLRRT